MVISGTYVLYGERIPIIPHEWMMPRGYNYTATRVLYTYRSSSSKHHDTQRV